MTKHTFTFDNGLIVNLRKISQFMLQRLMVDNTDKYPVPKKLVTLGTRKEEKLIDDYDNPSWRGLVTAQERKDLSETLNNLAVFAVTDDVPEDQFEFYRDVAESTITGEVSKTFVKGLWLLDQIETEEELGKFQEAILGINHATESGVGKSQEKFPDTD